jgi:hypothetical protein
VGAYCQHGGDAQLVQASLSIGVVERVVQHETRASHAAQELPGGMGELCLGVQILIALLGHTTHNLFAFLLVKDSVPPTSTQGRPRQPHQASPVLSPADSDGKEAYHPPRGMR